MSTCERFDALDELSRALLPAEQAEVDAHLATCRGCAALSNLGPTLRADVAPGADDAALIATAAARARDGALRQRRSVRATTAMLAVAALLVASGAWAAWSALSGDDGGGPQSPAAIAPSAPDPGAAPAAPPTADPPAPPEVAPVRPPTEGEARRPLPAIAPAPRASHSGGAAPAAASASPAAPEDASTLLAQANAHRRRGENQEAIARYRALMARFPGSREEVSSRVMFGNLLLDSDPAAALSRFDAYLGAGAGALAEEAWVGRAVALERLGREADARQAWRELLQRFPASVHGDRARARLGAH